MSYTSHLPSLQAQSKVDPLKTTYASAPNSKQKNEWVITIKRIGAPLEVTIQEVKDLEQMANQANTAILWYETLFTAPHIPKPTIAAKPPSGSLRRFNGIVGDIQRDKIRYEIYLLQHDLDRAPAGVIHSLTIYAQQEDRRGASSWEGEIKVLENGYPVFHGDWIRDMMIHVTHAAAAAQKQEAYSFVGNHQGARYEVSADPSDKTARLRIHPKFDASDLSFVDTVFDLNTAREIASLILRGDEAAKWFKDNKALFVAPVVP